MFSDLSLISHFDISENCSSLEHFSHDFIIDSEVQTSFCLLIQTFSLNLTYIPDF